MTPSPRPSSDASASPPARFLRHAQVCVLKTLQSGKRAAPTGLRGVTADQAEGVVSFRVAVLKKLLSLGFIREEGPSFVITEQGLHALEVLPRRRT